MPMYAYKCARCGAEEEHIERFSDPPKAECDACGGPLARLISPTAFHLKGGGWYKDGYGSSRAPSGGAGDSAGSTSTSTTPATPSAPGYSGTSGGSGGSSSGGTSAE
jgi:putative FmdB family regulatory protein